MLKKIVSMCIVLTLLWSSTLIAWGAQSRPVKYTLEKAMDAAVENSSSLKLLEDKIKLAERRYNMAVAASKVAPEKYWSTDAQHVSNKNEELLFPLQREEELKELKRQMQYTEKQLRIDVASLYYKILQTQSYIEEQDNIISRAKMEYEAMKKKVATGVQAQSMLLSYEISVKDAEAKLTAYQRDISNLYMSFNESLGLGLDVVVAFANAELPEVNFHVDDVDKLALDVVAASHDVKKLETEKLITKTKYDILYQYSFYRPDECDALEDSLLNSDYSIRDKKIAVELKVRSDYNDLLNLGDEIAITKMDYELKGKLLDIAQTKYELGLSTYLDFAKAEGEKDAALISYNKAKLDYYIAAQSFLLYIDPVEIGDE